MTDTELENVAARNVTPIRPLDEAAALAWLKSQPGGRTNLPAAELVHRFHVSNHITWPGRAHRTRYERPVPD
jgi:hypothetical protein